MSQLILEPSKSQRRTFAGTPGQRLRILKPRAEPRELPWTGERLVPTLRGDIVLEHLHRYAIAAELVAGKDVLDIASGEGYGTNLLAGCARSVVGVDVSDEAVRHSRQKYVRANLSFHRGTCAAIPLPDGSVDVVVSFETLEHFVEQELFVTEVRRVLRPGGVFIVSTPDRAVYTDQLGSRNPFHPRELDAVQFASLLRGAFVHSAMLNQRVALGSCIALMDGSAVVQTGTHRGEFDAMTFTPGVAGGVYLIGIASDAALPVLRAGLFEFGREEGDRFVTPVMAERAAHEAVRRQDEAARRGSEIARTQAEQSVLRLEKELAEERARVAALRESMASVERWQRSWFRRVFHRWHPKKAGIPGSLAG